MPRYKRSRLKRIIAQADLHCQESLYRVKEMHGIFAPTKPDHAMILEVAAQHLFQTRDLLRAFWGKSWGHVPDDLGSYLGHKPKGRL